MLSLDNLSIKPSYEVLHPTKPWLLTNIGFFISIVFRFLVSNSRFYVSDSLFKTCLYDGKKSKFTKVISFTSLIWLISYFFFGQWHSWGLFHHLNFFVALWLQHALMLSARRIILLYFIKGEKNHHHAVIFFQLILATHHFYLKTWEFFFNGSFSELTLTSSHLFHNYRVVQY